MDGANSTQSSAAASSKRKGKQCAAFGCSNAFYGADGSPTFHFFHFPRDAKQEGVDGASISNGSMEKIAFL